MRLGEIKQKIDRVLNEKELIELKSTNYGGAGILYSIENYSEIIDALHVLSDEEWTDLNKLEIEEIISQHPLGSNIAFSTEEFKKINSDISLVNTKLPIFYPILKSIVEPQEQQIINIKLPDDFDNLEDLTKFNGRIEKLFKSFQVDGEFKFKGFDKGTSWYEILIVGSLTYPYFIGCLKIAQEYFKTKTEFFTSREAQISYEIIKQKSKDIGKEEYEEAWFHAFIKREVEILVKENIKELNGETQQSLQNKLVVATTLLVKELGEGTEFHLSLNPPEYATEQAGQLVIDYKKIQDLKPKKNQGKIEPAKLTEGEVK